MSVLGLTVSAAVLIAMCSAGFGVGMARLIWADDLRHAQRIDENRSRIEEALRRTVASQERTIVALQGTVDTLKRGVSILDGARP